MGMAALSAKADERTIYKAYVTNSMSEWKSIIDAMETNPLLSDAKKMELLNYQYGYIGWCIENNKKEVAELYITKAEKLLAYLKTKNYQPANLHVYQGAIYGFKVNLNPFKAPVLGMKSIDEAKLAMQKDANNAMGYLLYGNTLYYRPSAFGGSKTEAIDYYLIAERKMELSAQGNVGNWNYLNLLAIIGKAYHETGNIIKAKEYYNKALTFEPNFVWVKNDLLPKLNKSKT
jgi:tetratricopeptide (TPR) repeat protein